MDSLRCQEQLLQVLLLFCRRRPSSKVVASSD